MATGRITGEFGEAPRKKPFVPQGYAYPAEVSVGIVQSLLGTYGSRTAPEPVLRQATVVSAGAARGVSAGAAQYTAKAEQMLATVDGLEYAKDIIGMYPGGRAGLVSELGDAFYLILKGDSDGGITRIGQIQTGFEQAAELVSSQKLADLQRQIDYLMALSDKMAKELPYGEQWFLETAEANIRAKYGSGGNMLKSQYEALEAAERQRLREIAWKTEDAMNAYLAQAAQLQGFANSIGAAVANIVTKLFAAVVQEIQKIAAEGQAAQDIINKAAAAARAAEIAKYCSEQTAAMNNYIRLTNEFNAAVKSNLDEFKATSAAFWNKLGV